MSRNFLIALMVSAIIVVAAIEYWKVHYYPSTPAGIQQAGMAQTRAHLSAIQKRLDEDARFKDVRLYVYTGLDGAIGVAGTVATGAVLEELKHVLDSTDLPRPVHWSVSVLSAD